MSYETLIFYSVVTSVITLDRVDLKKRVVDAPEILTVIDSIPNLTPFLNSLYDCQYGSFFKASDTVFHNTTLSIAVVSNLAVCMFRQTMHGCFVLTYL